MKVTVGRIVHYYQSGSDEPVAAIIAKVNKDDTVNLTAFDPCPHPGALVHSKWGVFYSQTPQPGYWSWPPREQVLANG